jgi:hypothetical protein
MEKLFWLVPLVAAAGFVSFFLTLLCVRRLATADKRWAAAGGQPYFCQYGEAIVGRMHVKRPFAHVTATPVALRLVVNWKDYEFPRRSIELVWGYPYGWGGLRINHQNPDYPSPVVFVSLDTDLLRRELETLGYTPRSD